MAKHEYIYGYHALAHLLTTQPEITQILYVQDTLKGKRAARLTDLARRQGITVAVKTRAALAEFVPGVVHQGVVAKIVAGQQAGRQPATQVTAGFEGFLSSLEQKKGPYLVLALDGIQDPHNLGACLRTACAMGVDAVIVPKDKAVGLTPAVRKVASGAAERVPFFQVTNLARALNRLKAKGIWLYGAAEQSEQSLYEADLSGSVAWVVGSEAKGLRRLTRECCDYLVHIPTVAAFSTLNVSVATGICLAETRRQLLL